MPGSSRTPAPRSSPDSPGGPLPDPSKMSSYNGKGPCYRFFICA